MVTPPKITLGLVIPAKATIHPAWVRAFAGTTLIFIGDDADFHLVGWAAGPWPLGMKA